MIKGLVKLATHLDSKGYRKEASYLDDIIIKLSEGLDDLGGPTDGQLDAILEGDESSGTVPILDGDEMSSDFEFTGDAAPGSIEAILGEDMPVDIMNNDDWVGLSKAILKSPTATADWFVSEYSDNSGGMQSGARSQLASFFTAGLTLVQNSKESEQPMDEMPELPDLPTL